METFLPSLVAPPVFDRAPPKANSRKRRKAFSRQGKASHSTKHSQKNQRNGARAGLSARTNASHSLRHSIHSASSAFSAARPSSHKHVKGKFVSKVSDSKRHHQVPANHIQASAHQKFGYTVRPEPSKNTTSCSQPFYVNDRTAATQAHRRGDDSTDARMSAVRDRLDCDGNEFHPGAAPASAASTAAVSRRQRSKRSSRENDIVMMNAVAASAAARGAPPPPPPLPVVSSQQQQQQLHQQQMMLMHAQQQQVAAAMAQQQEAGGVGGVPYVHGNSVGVHATHVTYPHHVWGVAAQPVHVIAPQQPHHHTWGAHPGSLADLVHQHHLHHQRQQQQQQQQQQVNVSNYRQQQQQQPRGHHQPATSRGTATTKSSFYVLPDEPPASSAVSTHTVASRSNHKGEMASSSKATLNDTAQVSESESASGGVKILNASLRQHCMSARAPNSHLTTASRLQTVSPHNSACVSVPEQSIADENSAFPGNFAQLPVSGETRNLQENASHNVAAASIVQPPPSAKPSVPQCENKEGSSVQPVGVPSSPSLSSSVAPQGQRAKPNPVNDRVKSETQLKSSVPDESGDIDMENVPLPPPPSNFASAPTNNTVENNAAKVENMEIPDAETRRRRAHARMGRTLTAEQRANDCDSFLDSSDILNHMRESEKEYAPLVVRDYMSLQKSLNNRMRLIVIDWLFEVEQEYNLDDRTMFLAASYLDRFLSQISVRRGQLQLVGTTCLYLASKFQEIDPPTASQYTFIADRTFSIKQLFEMEAVLLDVLSWRLAATTSFDFLELFVMKLDLPEKVEHFAQYLLSLLLESAHYGRFLPSQEAAAALYLAKLTVFGDASWTAEHRSVCKYSLLELKGPVDIFDNMHRQQYEKFVSHYRFDRGSPGHAVSDKFSAQQYSEVSNTVAPLKYNGPRITQPCDPQKLAQGAMQCR